MKVPHLIGLCALFALLLVIVNPLRETAVDDDWAYARTVQHLLDTGHYELHPWAAANMPFQIYAGSLICRVVGYSNIPLRLLTLTQLLLGLIAFYFLALEHRLNSSAAFTCAVALLASPLVVNMSFSFMTDVPFLAWLIIALLFYTRAIRRLSYAEMLAGAVAASAAILTRQFGVALMAGVVWQALPGGALHRKYRLLLVGLALPAVAAAWQIYSGLYNPNWGARYAKHAEEVYFRSIPELLWNVLSRLAQITQLLAVYSLPLVLVAALIVICALASRSRRSLWSAVGVGAYLLIMLISHAVNSGALFDHTDFHIEGLPVLGNHLAARAGVWLLSIVGAVAFILIVVRHVRKPRTDSTAAIRLLQITSGCLLLFYLLYFQMYDEYIIALLPFALLTLAPVCLNVRPRLRWAVTAGCAAIMIACALATRAELSYEEAYWRAAEHIRSVGISENNIASSWEWMSYYTFYDYLADIGYRTVDNTHDYYARWLPERIRKAEYVVGDSPNGHVLERIPYRGRHFEEHFVYVSKRELPSGQRASR